MKIRAVIVDDEQMAREVLSNYLSKYCPSVELLSTAANIREAVPLIQQEKPQLVFLDVEMPFGNAFDVLEACADQSFETIFITAFSEYSMKALNTSAAYYILKPIDIAELIKAVDKVANAIEQKDELNRNRVLLQNMKAGPSQQQLVLPTMQGFDVVKAATITRLQAKGNFTEIFFTDGSHKLVCKFLKHFDDLLDAPFLRVHRSFIVNMEYVKSYSKSSGGYLTLQDGSEIEVSSSYKDHFLQQMGMG